VLVDAEEILTTLIQSVERNVVYTTLPSSPQLLKPVPSLGSGGFCRWLALGQRSNITYSDGSGDLQ